MGKVEKLVPKDGVSPSEYMKEFISRYGEDVKGVIILALHKDGEMIDGWSPGVEEDVILWLGALEQLKMDFWNTLFTKRNDVI